MFDVTCPFRRSIDQIVAPAIVGAVGLCSVVLPGEASAQLMPWGGSSNVLVDESVTAGAAPGGFFGSSGLSGGTTSELLPPPPTAPRSKLLTPRPPTGAPVVEQPLPQVSLTPPSLRQARRTPPARLAAQPATPEVAKPPPPLTKLEPASVPPPMPMVTEPTPAPPPPTTAPKTPESQQQAARVPDPGVAPLQNVAFAPGNADLPGDSRRVLDSFAASLTEESNLRMQLLAYAGGPNLSASQARRLSLSRALAVRSYLISKGIRSTRIDVRALGNKVPSGTPNRVDLRTITR